MVSAMFLAALARGEQGSWTSNGPNGVGSVLDLAVGDTAAYAATLNGVFRSVDGAASWQPSGFAGRMVERIVADPGASVVFALSNGRLSVSRDRGATWGALRGVPGGVPAIDPWNPATVFLAAYDATLWRSTDAGSSWQRMSATPASSPTVYGFAFDSVAVYILVFDASDGLVKLARSSDGGSTWTIMQSLPSRSTGIASGRSPGVLYSGIVNGFCRSADSAASWTCASFPVYPTRILEIPGSASGGSPRLVASAPDGVYASGDGGATWTHAGGELASSRYRAPLASDASGALTLAGTDLTIFRSPDGGASWTRAAAGLNASIIDTLAADPQEPSTLWAAGRGIASSSNPGLFRSTDRGLTWSQTPGPGSLLNPGVFAIDPEDSSRLYGARSSVFRSEDGGAAWTSSTPPGGAGVHALAIDPGAHERVWAASHALFHSDDGARTWNPPPSVTQEVYSLIFGRRPGTLYAGSYLEEVPSYYPGYSYLIGGALFTSRDSGATFTKGRFDFGGKVAAIASDPFDDRVLYVGNPVGVFRSADDGATWTPPPAVTDVQGVTSLVADPIRPNRLYALAYGGLYRTVDGAQTWHPFSSGLESLEVLALAISPDGQRLSAGTNGGGVFGIDLAEASPCVPSATRLCLVANRYAVDLMARHAGERFQSGSARSLADRAGYFGLPFATGDPDLPEVVVKMLPDGTFGPKGAPIFYASLTTLPYTFTVTDTVTGDVQVYTSDLDEPLCGGTGLSFGSAAPVSAPKAASASEPLRLLGGRFSVTLEARDSNSGRTAAGTPILTDDRFGFLSLPDLTGDSQFPEVVVKMVDARSFAGEFWFFHSSLTNLDYTLTVRDSVTGAVRTYESGSPFCGTADTHAFTDPPADAPSLAGVWHGTVTRVSDDRPTCSATVEVHQPQPDVVEGRIESSCFFALFETTLSEAAGTWGLTGRAHYSDLRDDSCGYQASLSARLEGRPVSRLTATTSEFRCATQPNRSGIQLDVMR
jgi:photosystem II stability/assembly factor-like uncharacterized protein